MQGDSSSTQEQNEITTNSFNLAKSLTEGYSWLKTTIYENHMIVWALIFAIIILLILKSRYQQYVESRPIKYGNKDFFIVSIVIILLLALFFCCSLIFSFLFIFILFLFSLLFIRYL
jgi:hypothetical protein